MERTIVGILIGDLISNSLQTRIMFAILYYRCMLLHVINGKKTSCRTGTKELECDALFSFL